MKFGLSMEMVNLHYQEPNRNSRECKFFWDELYSLISAAGFDTIEIPYEPKWDFGGRSGIPRTARSIAVKFGSAQNYRSVLAQSGINSVAGVHLDPSIFIGDKNIDMYFGAFAHFAEEAIGFAKGLGASYVTLTVTPPFVAVRAACPQDTSWDSFSEVFLQRTRELIEELAAEAKKQGIILCLKNEFWSLLRGNNIIPFIRSLRNKVYLDIDTANLLIAGVDPAAVIQDNSDIIGCVHFTDTAFVDNAEFLSQPMPEFPAGHATQVFRDIGQGKVDFPAIASALTKAHYDGHVVYNPRQTRDVCRAMLRARHYTNTKLASWK